MIHLIEDLHYWCKGFFGGCTKRPSPELRAMFQRITLTHDPSKYEPFRSIGRSKY